jgi:hypothetical protein
MPSIERKYLLTALVELEQGTPTEIVGRIQATMTREDRQQWQQGTPGKMGAGIAGNRQGTGRCTGYLHRARSMQVTLTAHAL